MMSLFDALEQGMGSAVCLWAQPHILTVEEQPESQGDGYQISMVVPMRGPGTTNHLYERVAATYDELVSMVEATPFLADSSAGWMPNTGD